MADSVKQRKRSVCIFVLGMHRSGTSVFAGTLGLLGLSLPKELEPPDATNPKGFFESPEIMALHDEMLSALGSSWVDLQRLDPAIFNSAPGADFRQRLAATVRSEYDDASAFVLKDPRICRFFPFWNDVIGDVGAEARAVLIIRNPLEVARSLQKRDGLPLGYGLNLWLRHVLDAEYDTRHTPRVLLTYEEFIRDWVHAVNEIERGMGITLLDRTPQVRAAVETLIDQKLRHHVVDDKSLVVECKRNPLLLKTYRALEALCKRSNDSVAMKDLDEVRQIFDEAVNLFSYRVETDLTVSQLKNEVSVTRARIDKAEKALAALEYERNAERERYKTGQLQLEEQVSKSTAKMTRVENELSLIKRSLGWRLGAPLRLFAMTITRATTAAKRIFGL